MVQKAEQKARYKAPARIEMAGMFQEQQHTLIEKKL